MGWSNGFEQKCFQRQLSVRKRQEMEIYAWGVNDIEYVYKTRDWKETNTST